jgi:hypothetical protein
VRQASSQHDAGPTSGSRTANRELWQVRYSSTKSL